MLLRVFLNKIIVFVLFIVCTTLHSQEDSTNHQSTNLLDEVVVTATRTKKQLAKVPMPILLVSEKEIKKLGSTRLREVLLEQTGIVMVSDFGNSEGLQLQGMDAEYTLILIDGQPLIGRTSGNIDLNRIAINNIKQIEIVKGASSSLYGSEALGGVVNIITETPTKTKGKVSYMTRFGAKEELDINGNFVYKKEKLGIVGGVNLNSSGGFDLTPNSEGKTAYPHQNYTGNLRISYDFSEKLNASVSGRYLSEEIRNPQSNATLDDVNYTAILHHQISDKIGLKYTFYGTNYKTKSIFNDEVSVYEQALFQPEIKSEFKLKNSIIIAGIGVKFDALQRTFFDGKERYNSKFAFAQYDFHPLKKLNIILGARFDAFDKFKSAFSPKFSVRYKINDWFSVKSSVGLGYKVPDFRQLFFNFRNISNGYVVFGTETLHNLYGNELSVQQLSKELKPESSIGYNVGFQLHPTEKMKFNINFFRNDIKDLINTFVVSRNFPDLQGVSVFSYENRSEVYTQGIEFDASYKLHNNFKFLVGYQFLDTADKEELRQIENGTVFYRPFAGASAEKLKKSDYFGLANRSKHTANCKLFYDNYQYDFSANIRAIFRSKYALFDTNENAGIVDRFDDFVGSNMQVNMAVQKLFFNFLNLQIGVDNIFSEKGEKNITTFGNLDTVLRLGRTFYSRLSVDI